MFAALQSLQVICFNDELVWLYLERRRRERRRGRAEERGEEKRGRKGVMVCLLKI